MASQTFTLEELSLFLQKTQYVGSIAGANLRYCTESKKFWAVSGIIAVEVKKTQVDRLGFNHKHFFKG